MPEDDRWLIWSYEHDAWWGPGEWGYTSTLAEAGHYERADAERIVARANLVTVNEVAVPLAEAATFPPAMDDAAIIAALVLELQRIESPIEAVLRPATALEIVGLLQLARRHPALTPRSDRTAVTFIEHVRAYFRDHEAAVALEILRRGDDPRHDQ